MVTTKPKVSFSFADNETGNSSLAAALLSVGIEPFGDKPYRKIVGDVRGGERFLWKFMPVSPCGKFRTAELIAAWDDEDWHLRNPEHPFAYVYCAFRNRERLVDLVKGKAPLAAIRRNGKVGLISLAASQEKQDRVLARLER